MGDKIGEIIAAVLILGLVMLKTSNRAERDKPTLVRGSVQFWTR